MTAAEDASRAVGERLAAAVKGGIDGITVNLSGAVAVIFDDEERTTLNIAPEGAYVAVLQYHDPGLPPSLHAKVAADDAARIEQLIAITVEVMREINRGDVDLADRFSDLWT